MIDGRFTYLLSDFPISSPSSMTFDDTYNTLKYANRAKNIKANASQMKIIFKQPNFYDFSLQFQLKQNVMSVDFHISQYPKIVEKLKEEVWLNFQVMTSNF